MPRKPTPIRSVSAQRHSCRSGGALFHACPHPTRRYSRQLRFRNRSLGPPRGSRPRLKRQLPSHCTRTRPVPRPDTRHIPAGHPASVSHRSHTSVPPTPCAPDIHHISPPTNPISASSGAQPHATAPTHASALSNRFTAPQSEPHSELRPANQLSELMTKQDSWIPYVRTHSQWASGHGSDFQRNRTCILGTAFVSCIYLSKDHHHHLWNRICIISILLSFLYLEQCLYLVFGTVLYLRYVFVSCIHSYLVCVSCIRILYLEQYLYLDNMYLEQVRHNVNE